jgi:hypothetical protein
VEVNEALMMAKVQERSERLFADGYRGQMTDTDEVLITNAEGVPYRVDLLEDACSCPFFLHWGGHYKCKHLLGWGKLITDQGTATGNPKFPLGTVVATPGAVQILEQNRVTAAELLIRHSMGDWGQMDADDRRTNEQALLNGTRLLSQYPVTDSQNIWIITEWDRSRTVVLLPEEY